MSTGISQDFNEPNPGIGVPPPTTELGDGDTGLKPNPITGMTGGPLEQQGLGDGEVDISEVP